ncbi:ParB/RepB/Spo0J family partition protein [Candidatus Falkowbacteria bacterium]|jgi:ParB family transcriptional regulator, chromosome partitioning protein|nr:ParB/RepB/Spo0J family partition protein [Candidatus Falkowbacteria bacterium]MBT4433173.1 ParB/RepB/Spo0J family partition protein [Candidatus Falkowbacteria bacterium]
MKKIGLGRGLSSLIPKKEIIKKDKVSGEARESALGQNKEGDDSLVFVSKDVGAGLLFVDIEKIKPNPYQPREKFSKESLSDLSASIKKHGILQPLIVTKTDNDNYELIAGERRLRASKLAGMTNVPVIIKKADNLEKLHLAIIENIQRTDLNPLEEARSFKRLADEFDMTHDKIAKEVGKSRSFISNTLRLLKLPKNIQDAIENGKLSSSQSRSLVSLSSSEQGNLFNKIINSKLTSRQTEDEARKVAVKTHTRVLKKDPNILAKEESLQRELGTKVTISKKGNSGKILIDFYSEEELNSIIEKILGD